MTDVPAGGQGAPDGERDAWLREALRHAPDAAMAAPPLLREAILSQARAAVAVRTPTRHPAPASAVLAFWSWLARPPVAAGFASVMAATLVGMMWWDRPMDEATPPPPAPASSRAAEQTTPAPAPVPPPEPARDELHGSLSPPSPPRRRDSAAAFPGEAKLERSAGGTGAAKAEAGAGTLDKQRQPVEDLARQAPSSMAAPATPPAGALGAAPDREADAFAPAPTLVPVPAPAQSRRAEAARSPQGNVAQRAVEPLAPLLAALAADASDWTRGAAEGRTAPVDPALRRWLAELDAAGTGRWSVVSASVHAGVIVELWQGGRPAATVSVDAVSATVESRLDGTARAWRAELDPVTAERLRRSLPRPPP